MTRYRGIEKSGMVLAAMAAAAMCALSFFMATGSRLQGGLGICLPSTNLWEIPPLWSWIINTALTATIAVGAALLNRHYNFIRSTQPVLPALFVVLAASNPWATSYLSSSTIVCAVNLLAISIMFSCFRLCNATQQLFVVATLISVGSMFQYAFIPYILAYVASAIQMKAFRIKEFLAMGMGLIAPYWVGIGLGLVRLDSFSMPEITNLFNGFAHASDIFTLLLSAVVAIFLGLILGLNNSIKLYAGNSRVNSMNLTISLVGVVSIICIIIDFSNMMAYLTTLYLTVAVQVANLGALWHFKREWLLTFIPGVIYIVFFVILLLS